MDIKTITSFFLKAVEAGASDVHIVPGAPVLLRIDGELKEQGKADFTPAQVEGLVRSLLGPQRYKEFEQEHEIDLSLELKNNVRVRINCHFIRGQIALSARLIPKEIPSLKQLELEEIVQSLSKLKEGLILFTGPTGSGKSTAMASLIQSITLSRPVNVITLEDPIEFVIPRGEGVVRQREYGEDFHSFPEGLRRVLRQDPDIVMVGEMRDPETIAAALTLAETGHLIIATLHTPNTSQAVDRIVDVFPPHQQPQVRSQLSLSLKAVIAQRLLPAVGGGRVALREILLMNAALAHTIRENRAQEIKTILQTNESSGMMSFDKAAKKLYKEGKISKETYEGVGSL